MRLTLSRPSGRALAMRIVRALVALSLLLPPLHAEPPGVTTFRLESGLEVVHLRHERAGEVALVTFLPLGLAADGADRVQWSHLLEHLLLRTTGPIRDYRKINGETGADVLRLDYLGGDDELHAGLEHLGRWLTEGGFEANTLTEEVPRVLAEVDHAARSGFTHKWAIAAWNQVHRHGRSEVSLRDAVKEARLEEVEAYRRAHLGDPARILLVGLSAGDPASFRRAVEESLGFLQPGPRPLPQAASRAPGEKNLEVSWDLPVRHHLEYVRAPASGEPGHAALQLYAQRIRYLATMTPTLLRITHFVACDLDLRSPEGTHFSLSASLKKGASFEEVERELEALRQRAARPDATIPFLARNLALSLERPADLDRVLASPPAGVEPRLLAANLALQFGMQVYRHGEHRAKLARELREVDGKAMREAVEKHLEPGKWRRLHLVPRDP